MKKLISVLSVMLILFASVWAMIPALAAEIPAVEELTTTADEELTTTADEAETTCTEHVFTDWSAAGEASCTMFAYQVRSCMNSGCDYAEVEKIGEKLSHVPADGAYIHNADEATHSFVCATCNAVITEICTPELVVANITDGDIENITDGDIGNITDGDVATETYRCSVCMNTLTASDGHIHIIEEWNADQKNMRHFGECVDCGVTVFKNCNFIETGFAGNCMNGGKISKKCVDCNRVTEEDCDPMQHTVEAWHHVSGTSRHVGVCVRCDEKFNNDCTLTNFTTNYYDDGTPAGTHTVACTVCNAQFAELCNKGDYIGIANTAQHKQTCKSCNAVYTEDCDAAGNKLTANKNGSHTGICAYCASAFTRTCTAGKATHIEGTETHSTVCTECGDTFTEACEVKTWISSTESDVAMVEVLSDDGDANPVTSGDVVTDESEAEKEEPVKEYKHTGNCEKCAAVYVKDCTPGAFTVDTEKGICTSECTECKQIITHTSKLSEFWTYDAEKNTHNRKCTICNATASHTVNLADQTWENVKDVNGNYHAAVCADCGTDVLADCTFKTDATDPHKQVCTVCGYTYSTTCAETGDFMKDKEKSTEPTCTEKGYTYYKCSVCGKIDDSQTKEYKALGHDKKVDDKADIKSTDKDHTVTYFCSKCDFTETVTEAHKLGNATKGTNGNHTKECSVCKKVVTEKCKEEIIKAVPATCTETGLSAGSKCSECGAILKEQTTTSALGHNHKFVSTTATCSTAGKDKFMCICGDIKEVDAAATGNHEFGKTAVKYVPATASENGYLEYKCVNCTETYRQVLTYSVKTGISNGLSPVAAVILLSGAAFVGVKKLRKETEED